MKTYLLEQYVMNDTNWTYQERRENYDPEGCDHVGKQTAVGRWTASTRLFFRNRLPLTMNARVPQLHEGNDL